MIDTHGDLARCRVDEPIVLCGLAVCVAHKAVGGITRVPERKHVKEVAIRQIVVFQDVLSPTSGAHQGEAGKECVERHFDQMSGFA